MLEINEENDQFKYECHYYKSKNIIVDENNYYKHYIFENSEIYELWHCLDCNKDFGVLLVEDTEIEIVGDKG